MSNTSGGKVSARVYRRRRITVAVLALVLIGLLAWGISAVVGMFSAEQPQAPQTQGQNVQASPSPSSSEQADEASQNLCKSGEIEVVASLDKRNYAPEENPVLTLSIENTSKRDCEINVGTSQQEFLISSGSDRIFSTVDCLANSEDVLLKFAAGQKESAKFSWDRKRSAPGCKAINAQPLPGTYKFTAALGEVTSEPVTFELK